MDYRTGSGNGKPCFNQRSESQDKVIMRESQSAVDWTSRIQLSGVLSKRPFGHQSSKWTRRFFIIKDGFLLYYPDNERKDFDKRKFLNIHPKGVVPLGGCVVSRLKEQAHPFCIHIKSEEIEGNMVLSADNEFDQDKWVNELQLSTRITWKNAQLGDTIIQRLEDHGLRMAMENEDIISKMQSGALELEEERLKTEELERVKEELEKEKHKMEKLATELREEYMKMKGELEDTSEALRVVADEKLGLNRTTQDLQTTLESLANEKKQILTQLEVEQNTAQKLYQEKSDLAHTSESFQQHLAAIEEKTNKLLQEKSDVENKLREKEERARMLEGEKETIHEHALELKQSIKDLSAQKALTEAELKEEVLARLDAEYRLHQAEASLIRLEKAVRGEGTEGRGEKEVQEEMIGDVKNLKGFFENLAYESKLDADKSIMIKNSIHARKTLVRRAKTMKYEASKRKTRALSMPPIPSSPLLQVLDLPPSPLTPQDLEDFTF